MAPEYWLKAEQLCSVEAISSGIERRGRIWCFKTEIDLPPYKFLHTLNPLIPPQPPKLPPSTFLIFPPPIPLS